MAGPSIQTARKTSGAPATKRQLPRRAAREQAAKTAAINAPLKTQAKQAQELKLRAAPSENPAASSLSPIFQAVPIPEPAPGEEIGLCYGCHGGGALMRCYSCAAKLCYRTDTLGSYACLTIQPNVDLNNLIFCCPRCHAAVVSEDGANVPYVGFYQNDANKTPAHILVKVTQNAECALRLLAPKDTLLISISLDGSRDFEAPMAQAYSCAAYYFTGCKAKLESVSLPFAFDKVTSLNRYEEGLKTVIEKLQSCKAAVVYFTTHCTPEGLLHFSGPSGPGSSDAVEVLKTAFPPNFVHALRSIEHASLFFTVCSEYRGEAGVYEWMRDHVVNGTFKEAISFMGALQPQFVAPLAATFFQYVHIECEPASRCMIYALEGLRRLGGVGDVVLLEKNLNYGHWTDGSIATHRYFWSRYDLAPYGIPRPMQCPQCTCLHTLSTRELVAGDAVAIEFYCTSSSAAPAEDGITQQCGYVERHNIPLRRKGLRGVDNGCWLLVMRVIEAEKEWERAQLTEAQEVEVETLEDQTKMDTKKGLTAGCSGLMI
ncbi:hypothetical protein ONZ45_g9761 [Pleurotus djamor]|nr:hypothetical protein ONZ45_g9761 [Pleurotus djamor]